MVLEGRQAAGIIYMIPSVWRASTRRARETRSHKLLTSSCAYYVQETGECTRGAGSQKFFGLTLSASLSKVCLCCQLDRARFFTFRGKTGDTSSQPDAEATSGAASIVGGTAGVFHASVVGSNQAEVLTDTAGLEVASKPR